MTSNPNYRYLAQTGMATDDFGDGRCVRDKNADGRMQLVSRALTRQVADCWPSFNANIYTSEDLISKTHDPLNSSSTRDRSGTNNSRTVRPYRGSFLERRASHIWKRLKWCIPYVYLWNEINGRNIFSRIIACNMAHSLTHVIEFNRLATRERWRGRNCDACWMKSTWIIWRNSQRWIDAVKIAPLERSNSWIIWGRARGQIPSGARQKGRWYRSLPIELIATSLHFPIFLWYRLAQIFYRKRLYMFARANVSILRTQLRIYLP